MSDPTREVELLIERSGLRLTDDERERLIRMYPDIQAWVESLRLAEARYAEPALTYRADDER